MRATPKPPALLSLISGALLGCLSHALLVSPAAADERGEGLALLQKNCSRCHAVAADETSPLAKAPNLWTVLRSYPVERLDFELAEGIGSTHPDMPQIQFTDEQITSIFYYLIGESGPGAQ